MRGYGSWKVPRIIIDSGICSRSLSWKLRSWHTFFVKFFKEEVLGDWKYEVHRRLRIAALVVVRREYSK